MTEKELRYKLKDYPNVTNYMLHHSAFNNFLSKASEEQLNFCEDYFDNKVEILWNESSAGVGKTLCSVACAYADYLKSGRNLRFIISPVAEDLGSRPGNQTEKEMAYFMGLHDALIELNMIPERVIFELANLDDNIKENELTECWVHQNSHLFFRGGNLAENVIINEAQNFTHKELKKMLTRLHTKGNTCVVEGNYKQIDLKNNSKSGFEGFLNYFKEGYSSEASKYHHFTKNYRSRLANFADDYNWKQIN